MSNELFFPVINKNHRLLCVTIKRLINRLEQGEGEQVSGLLFQLYNKLERYYLAHNVVLKHNYCSNCREQVDIRIHILDLVFKASIKFQQGHIHETIRLLYQLHVFLQDSMVTFQEQ